MIQINLAPGTEPFWKIIHRIDKYGNEVQECILYYHQFLKFLESCGFRRKPSCIKPTVKGEIYVYQSNGVFVNCTKEHITDAVRKYAENNLPEEVLERMIQERRRLLSDFIYGLLESYTNEQEGGNNE